jgi:hypothetical protein
VGAQIVHDDDIAWSDGVEQLLVDSGPEADAIDRAVEDARRNDPITSEGGHEGQGFPALTPVGDVTSCLLKSEHLRREIDPPDQFLLLLSYLKLKPSRLRNCQTVSCETVTPRAASSAFSPCSVRCDIWLIR